MLTCSEVRPAGAWDEAVSADVVVLDYDARHRRRLAMTGRSGLAFLLDLPRATALRNGDGLVLGDQRIVRVQAAAEKLLEIAATQPATLMRIAWHLGNRHLPMQVRDGRLYIRHDHVILDMIPGLHGMAVEIDAPFDPLQGALAHEHSHPHR